MKRQSTPRFVRAKVRALAREQVRDQRSLYETKRPEQVGTYGGNGEVIVEGKRYPFRDTQNIQPSVGDVLTMRNVGRRAVVIMAPTEGTSIT